MLDKISRDINLTYYNKRLKNRRKNIMKFLIIFFSIILLLGICGSITYNSGFIPIKKFLEIQKPIGKAEEIDIDEPMKKYPEIKNIPYIDTLKYKVYGTDKTIDAVADDYKGKLEKEGYQSLYEGIVYKKDIPFQYYGFLKGITAVGIIMTSDKNISLNHETIVLYSTGSAFNYRNLLMWYKANEGLFEDL